MTSFRNGVRNKSTVSKIILFLITYFIILFLLSIIVEASSRSSTDFARTIRSIWIPAVIIFAVIYDFMFGKPKKNEEVESNNKEE